MNHSATLMLVGEGDNRHVVATEADDVVWISYELLQEAIVPQVHRVNGGLEVDGELVKFGTAGEGLGRLIYRITGYEDNRLYAVAERVRESEES